MKKIKATVLKELRRVFTDQRMLFTLVLPGVMIYILYSVIGGINEQIFSVDDDHVFQIATVHLPEELEPLFEAWPYEIEFQVVSEGQLDTIKENIASSDIDLLMVFEEDFFAAMLAYDVSLGTNAPEIQLFFNGTSQESRTIYQLAQGTLQAFERELVNKFDINRDAEVTFNLATAEDESIQFIIGLVPFLLIVFLFTGAQAIASEAIAGEKERGTMATLLATPVKRSEIALGKIFALSMTVMVSATSSFLGLILSLPRLVGSENFTLDMYGPVTYSLMFIVLITTVLIFVVLISIISAYAKSIKEAASLTAPLMIFVFLISLTSMLGVASDNVWLYLVPIYNSVQSLTSILALNVNTFHLTLTILSNVFFVMLGILALAGMFASEKVMFNS